MGLGSGASQVSFGSTVLTLVIDRWENATIKWHFTYNATTLLALVIIMGPMPEDKKMGGCHAGARRNQAAYGRAS